MKFYYGVGGGWVGDGWEASILSENTVLLNILFQQNVAHVNDSDLVIDNGAYYRINV